MVPSRPAPRSRVAARELRGSLSNEESDSIDIILCSSAFSMRWLSENSAHFDVDVAKVRLSVFVNIDVVDAHGRPSSDRLITIINQRMLGSQGLLLALMRHLLLIGGGPIGVASPYIKRFSNHPTQAQPAQDGKTEVVKTFALCSMVSAMMHVQRQRRAKYSNTAIGITSAGASF